MDRRGTWGGFAMQRSAPRHILYTSALLPFILMTIASTHSRY